MQLHNIFNNLLGVTFNNQILNTNSQKRTLSICIAVKYKLKYSLIVHCAEEFCYNEMFSFF